MNRLVMDVARFGSIHEGDDSHRAVWRDPLRPTWHQTGAGRERRHQARNHPCPICGRKLSSTKGVRDHRQAKGH